MEVNHLSRPLKLMTNRISLRRPNLVLLWPPERYVGPKITSTVPFLQISIFLRVKE